MSRARAIPTLVWTTLRGGARGVGRGARAAAGAPRALWSAARLRPRRAYLALGVVAVVLLAIGGTFTMLGVRQHEVEQARTAAVATAETKIVQLLSYDYQTVAKDQDSRLALLTGRFKDDYGSLLKDVVVPAAEKQKLTTTSSVVASSVTEAAAPDHVVVLMYLNQTTQSAGQPSPTLSGSRLRVTMDGVDGDWLVSEMTPV